MKHQPTCRAGCINIFSQGSEPGASGLDEIDDFEKVFQAPGQAIVFRDDDHIPIPEFFQQPVQLWAVPGSSGDGVCENSFCSSGGQGVPLAVMVLTTLPCSPEINGLAVS